jgi:ATP-dependent Clp protease ATP-binding subunit ClpA
MSIHRWQKEFENALIYNNTIILYNNTRDKYLYLPLETTYAYELLNLTSYLVKFLRRRFKIIKTYDPVDKITDHSLKKGGASTTEKRTEADEFSRTAPRPSSTAQESTIDRDLVQISNELLSNSDCCYIFTFADKTIPSRPSTEDEQRILLRIEKMIQNMKPSNRLILIYLFEDQIPPDLYKNNPKTKLIYIPSPERNDFRILFQSYYKMNKEEIEKAVNISDGLKFLEVERLILCINPFDIKKFEEDVRLYKFGEKRDYWQEVSLEKLGRAIKFFTEESTEEGRGGIKGQDDAIRKVIGVLMNAVADIQRRTGGNPSRPKGVLFFAGPTGVGKTLTAQKLATFLFGSEYKLLRFDMSEYKEEFQVTRLYGAPPGYVGYEAGGTLTTAVKENPFSVILFDEIEKAHPRVLDIFLQILSDGRLTDSKGETVFFSESIIIFTSNIGTRAHERAELDILLQEFRENENDENEAKKIKEKIREHFRKCIENYFTIEISRPELLGRVGMDNIVVFDYISSEDVKKMFENYLLDLKTKFNKYSQNEIPSLQIEMDINEIADSLFNKYMKKIKQGNEFGGRDMVNLIDEHIRNKLAWEVLRAKKKAVDSGERKGIIRISIQENGDLDVKYVSV